jgi:isoleucyl-tRNA synthetase
MYTFAPTSKERRSAQTVLWTITETLARLVAPILSFTADEVWDYLPKLDGREASVHLAQFPAPEEVFSEDPTPLLQEWRQIFDVREAGLGKLEEKRQAKIIGKGLEADVIIHAKGELLTLLRRHAAGLKEIFNVSDVTITDEPGVSSLPEGMTTKVIVPSDEVFFEVRPASGSKCARCWNFMPEVSDYGIWQNVCTRCHGALKEMGIAPPEAAVE